MSLLAMASDIIVPDVVWQNVITHNRKPGKDNKPDTAKVAMPQVEIDEEVIPDSLLHPRWHIQRTTPITLDDLEQGPADLNRPDNLKQEVEYNDTLNRYVIGNKIGDSYISAPVMMTPEEYNAWSLKHSFADYAFSVKSKHKERRSSTSPTCTSVWDLPRRYSVPVAFAFAHKVLPS